MSLINYVRGRSAWDGPSKDSTGDSLLAEEETNEQTALRKVGAYRRLSVSLDDGQVTTGGSDTETVTIEVVDGLEVAEGTDPTDAAVLYYDGDVTLSVDGVETTKTLTNGRVEFDLTTEKSTDSEIEIVAESLADHPAESDSAIIEVVSQ